MSIADEVRAAYSHLSLQEKEARNIALASVLEPLSEKAGCVTRERDAGKNTLPMFLAAGVNIFPAYAHLTSFLQEQEKPEGMYLFFHEAVLLSKAHRDGGQINLGILEFSFPLVAAHVLYDPHSNESPDFLFSKATALLHATTPADVSSFYEGKKAARDISHAFRGKQYPVYEHDVPTVFDYYQQEFEREISSSGHPTGRTHNRQFLQGFPDIQRSWHAYHASEKPFLEKLVDAYHAVMNHPDNLGIGAGLGADFVAVTIYLVLTYPSNDMPLR
ncbi:triphosphoribosyl-dephospho-CoA synthase [Candidatus Woesearchaeota archaeon]|nr:triphosphoribosyl-dephospho-CoA synthase [Candidatus Woesearchaeota archaeon]